jgi:superfamily II DNA or RNA helicase
MYYKGYNDPNFYKMLNKYEFKDQPKRDFVYQDPRQLLMRNYISKPTIYDNILLFNALGTGKTCSSITIAESFKEYLTSMNRNVLVLVKNGNIERNFKNELSSMCTGEEYVTNDERAILRKTQDPEEKKEIKNKVRKRINKMYNFMTYGSFTNDVLGISKYEKTFKLNNNETVGKHINNLNNTVIIIDEAHHVTNGDTYKALEIVLKNSFNYKLILLTATPIFDNPKQIIELSNLLNMNNKNGLLPIRENLFKGSNPILKRKNIEGSVIKEGVISITDHGKRELMKSLNGKVSYLESNTQTFPDKIEIGTALFDKIGSLKVIYCHLSKFQNNIYKQAFKIDSNSTTNLQSDEININEDAKELITDYRSSSLYKNSSDASTFVYPNGKFGSDGFLSIFKPKKKTNDFELLSEFKHVLTTELHTYSSKLHKLLENIKNSPGNIFIYSNYVTHGGTSLIKQVLLANGYSQYPSNNSKTFIMYDNTITPETREQQRKTFNNIDNKDGKKIKIIIGSPIISEGITLKNIRQVHILEPSWNMGILNQIVGRAVRHHSHDDLEPQDRNVEIYKYCSFGDNPSDPTINYIDREKYILAEKKDRANKQVERILKIVSFDCFINNDYTSPQNKIDYTSQCDYQSCSYTCANNKSNDHYDTFMYNYYIQFFDKFDIEYNMNFIKSLFKKYFIWKTDDIITKIKEIHSMISSSSINSALNNFIESKIILIDQYNREGFLIKKGEYYIFNPLDIDINSSIYTKMLNFSFDSNKFSLNDYSKLKLNQDLDIIDQETNQEQESVEIISDIDIEYNEKIIRDNLIYGSYRKRGIKESRFGPLDKTFRIIDLRNEIQDSDYEQDNRKNITGMAATSYDKMTLIDIIEYLDISIKEIQILIGFQTDIEYTSEFIKTLTSKQLITIIKRFLEKKKLILH